jgi:predicted acyltransferase
MNPLFIYLFANVGGAEFVEHIIHPYSTALFGWSGAAFTNILTALSVLFLLWYICYWMYKKKIFIRI